MQSHVQEDGNEDADGLYDDVDALYGDDLVQLIDNVDVHVPVLPDKVCTNFCRQARLRDIADVLCHAVSAGSSPCVP
jgi:hypothetical protein